MVVRAGNPSTLEIEAEGSEFKVILSYIGQSVSPWGRVFWVLVFFFFFSNTQGFVLLILRQAQLPRLASAFP